MTTPALIYANATGIQSQITDHEARIATLEDGEFEQHNWEDLRVSLISVNAGSAQPPAFTRLYRNVGNTSEGVYAWGFTNSGEREVFFDVQMPHSWAYGTEVRPHVHWMHADSTPSGSNVRWGLEYVWANAVNAPGNTFGPTTSTVYADDPTIAPTLGYAPGTAHVHQIAQFTAIAGTNMRRSSVMLCRLFRDTGNDDFADLAFALSFDLHYQVATTGSSTEYAGAS